MKMADRGEMMSVPQFEQNFAGKTNVAHAWNRVKRNEMRDEAEEFTREQKGK